MRWTLRDAEGVEALSDRDVAGRLGLRVLTQLHGSRAPGGPCPACGRTRAQVAQTGLLGCGLCMSVFASDLGLEP